ncbi:MAG: hypothetical protein MRY59_13135 [Aquisalinus sp.]|nr:hypothetical protein [Aquisalinus sp.]
MTAFQLLVVFSVFSISLMAFILHRLGQSSGHIFDNEAAAISAFLEEFPDSAVDEVALSVDQRTAMMTLANEPCLGLVRAMGKFTLARKLAPEDIRASHLRDTELRLALKDFADPSFSIKFQSEELTRRWSGYLNRQEEPKTNA